MYDNRIADIFRKCTQVPINIPLPVYLVNYQFFILYPVHHRQISNVPFHRRSSNRLFSQVVYQVVYASLL